MLLSSLLVCLTHKESLAAGKGIYHTLLAIIFSVLFAMASALLLVTTGSIVIPILWYLGHNLASSIIMEASPQLAIAIVGFQCIIFIGYALFLWKKVSLLNATAYSVFHEEHWRKEITIDYSTDA